MNALIEAVRLEIDTYLDFREHGDRVGGAARTLHDKVLAYILTSSPAEMGIVPVDGARPRDFAYAPEAWEDVARQLDAGAVEFMGLVSNPANVSVTVELSSQELPGAANRVIVSLPVEPVVGNAALRDAVVDWFIDAAGRLDAATGYLTIDLPTDGSPYEDAVGIRGIDALQHVDVDLRGYFWGNILNSRHIERLGGLEHVRANAPCDRVAVLNEGELVYLQLTDSPANVPRERLIALRAFLSPVLPQARRRSPYAGPPLRVPEGEHPVTEAMWAAAAADVRDRAEQFGGEPTPLAGPAWEGIRFVVSFASDVPIGAQDKLRHALSEWFAVEAAGDSGPDYLSEVRFASDGARATAWWWVDFGSAEREALDRLVEAFHAAARHAGIGIEQIEVE